MKRNVQIVGRFESSSSIPGVTRELARVCSRSSRFRNVYVYSSDHVGVYPYRNRFGLYNDLPQGVTVDLTTDSDTIGLTFGHPEVIQHWLAHYPTKIAGVLCEVGFVSPDWVWAANAMSGVWAPSQWVAQIYRQSGVVNPIRIFRHGVAPWFEPELRARNDRFTFLAISNPFHHARKGLVELVQAFGMAFPHGGQVDLLLITDYSDELSDALRGVSAETAARVRVYMPPEPLGPAKMAHLLNAVHVLVAPSKAEGFGLGPCEARACHTPVALTYVTGHLEHLRQGVDLEIPVGPMELVGNDDNQQRGQVFSVPPDGLAPVLRRAYDDWSTLQAGVARSVRERPEPTWDEVLAEFPAWVDSFRIDAEKSVRW